MTLRIIAGNCLTRKQTRCARIGELEGKSRGITLNNSVSKLGTLNSRSEGCPGAEIQLQQAQGAENATQLVIQALPFLHMDAT